MRHFGLLASGNVNTKLVKARSLLKTRVIRGPSARTILETLIAASRRYDLALPRRAKTTVSVAAGSARSSHSVGGA